MIDAICMIIMALTLIVCAVALCAGGLNMILGVKWEPIEWSMVSTFFVILALCMGEVVIVAVWAWNRS